MRKLKEKTNGTAKLNAFLETIKCLALKQTLARSIENYILFTLFLKFFYLFHLYFTDMMKLRLLLSRSNTGRLQVSATSWL